MNRPTAFAQEYQQLLNAGYMQVIDSVKIEKIR